jgi:ubiquinone/menaquinone biosynthesis C-methylase UbiE
MSWRIGHWWFAQWYGLVSRGESAAMRSTRSRLVSGLTGEVLEAGVGNGLNLPHYDAGARVTAIDYNRHMLAKAAERARTSRAVVALEAADVQALPFDDDRFDHAVAALVFCSVADAERGLRELLRVTKPGGSVRLLEHVAAEPGWTRRAQAALSPLWSPLGDGCQLDRDTVATAERVGVIIEAVEPARGLPRLLPTRLIAGRSPGGG